jgi:hypothetical protein
MRPKESSKLSHDRRAARIDTRKLAQDLQQWEREQRKARAAIEAELRREHGGHLPESWHAGPEG